MAPRVQSRYQPQGTGLQSLSLPASSMVTPQFQTPQEDSATRLADALGVLKPQQIASDLIGIQRAEKDEAVQQATAYANSMTVDELGKKIKGGEVLPSQSPLFLATLQHVYGENTQKALQRDTLSGLASGQLKFQDPAELEKYLIEKRNATLAGADTYTTTGFDRGWNGFVQQAQNVNTQINDAQAVRNGISAASDNLGNVLLDVTAPTFRLKPQDAAGALMKRYELLSQTQLLRDDARKEAMGDLLTRVANSGNQDLTRELLGSKLPNNGPTVGAFLGESRAVSLSNHAEVQFDKAQRQRVDTEMAPFLRASDSGTLDTAAFQAWRNKNEKYVTSSTFESLLRQNQEAQIRQIRLNQQHDTIMEAQRITMDAAQNTKVLVDQRRGYQMEDFEVPTPDGSFTTIKGADLVAAEVQKRIAANPDMPLDEQVRLFANNSVENKAWKRSITAASANIGEVGIDAKGKPVGELLPATLEGLDQFSAINRVSTSYAREMAGGDRQYQLMTNIQALRESGVQDPNHAASLVNQAERNSGANMENITQAVSSAVNNITNPGVFTGRWWGEVFSGEWGNGDKNLLVIRGAVQSLAKAYMAAGVASTGEEAVKLGVEYYANPAISTQINNTIYFNKDLPRVPEAQNQREWLIRFMDSQVGDYLKSLEITYDRDDIVLYPMSGGEPRYMLSLKGTPLGKEYLKRDIEGWITDQNNRDITNAIEQRNRDLHPTPESSNRAFVNNAGGAAIGVTRKPK